MTNTDQPGEELDEALPDDYPPDEPLGADEQGVTGVEQLGGDSFAERDERTEPEVWERPQSSDMRPPVLSDEAEPGVVDEEKDLVATPLDDDGADDVGALAPDDDFTGDETTRDVATERAPGPAEEAAMRTQEDAPGATG